MLAADWIPGSFGARALFDVSELRCAQKFLAFEAPLLYLRAIDRVGSPRILESEVASEWSKKGPKWPEFCPKCSEGGQIGVFWRHLRKNLASQALFGVPELWFPLKFGVRGPIWCRRAVDRPQLWRPRPFGLGLGASELLIALQVGSRLDPREFWRPFPIRCLRAAMRPKNFGFRGPPFVSQSY